MVLLREKYIPSFDGMKLLYREYGQEDIAPVASLCLVHGFGEHSQRFAHVCEAFVTQNFKVHTIDLRGHGYSGGPRADGKFESLLKDVGVLIQRADPDLPLYLYGHSMGGLIVLRYLQTHQFTKVEGAIVASPFLRLDKSKQLSYFKRILLHHGSKVLGEFLVSSNVDPCGLSGKHEEITKVFHDRLSLPFMTVRFANELLTAADKAVESPHLIDIPCCIVHGDRDMVTCPKATIEFAQKVSSDDLTVHIVEGGLHELHHDNHQRHTINFMCEWLSAQVSKAKGPGSRLTSHQRRTQKLKTERPVTSAWIPFAKFIVAVTWLTPLAPILAIAHILEMLFGIIVLQLRFDFPQDYFLVFIFGMFHLYELYQKQSAEDTFQASSPSDHSSEEMLLSNNSNNYSSSVKKPITVSESFDILSPAGRQRHSNSNSSNNINNNNNNNGIENFSNNVHTMLEKNSMI